MSNTFANFHDIFESFVDPEKLSNFINTLGTIDVGKFEYNGFDLKAILEAIIKNAAVNKRSKQQVFADMIDIVLVGLTRGNVREDRLNKTVGDGAARIRELSNIYKIPIKRDVSVLSSSYLSRETLTFVRSLACFPHLASAILLKAPGLVKRGKSTTLKSETLPDVMKHSGFAGLIPTTVHDELQSVLLLGHVAYMIDFGFQINPKTKRTIKEAYAEQLSYAYTAQQNSFYTEDMKITYLMCFEFNKPEVLEKIFEVANNLLGEAGLVKFTKPEFVKKILTDRVDILAVNDEQLKKYNDDSTGLFNNLKVTSDVSIPAINTSASSSSDAPLTLAQIMAKR